MLAVFVYGTGFLMLAVGLYFYVDDALRRHRARRWLAVRDDERRARLRARTWERV